MRPCLIVVGLFCAYRVAAATPATSVDKPSHAAAADHPDPSSDNMEADTDEEVVTDENEAVWASAEIPLRARSVETGRVLGRAGKDERLEVVAHKGRWLQVRHGKVVGWVTRTEIERRTSEPRERP